MAGERNREIAAVAAALAVHVLLLALAPRRLLPRIEAPPPAEPRADTFDIEEEPASPRSRSEPPPEPAPLAPAPAAPRESQQPPGRSLAANTPAPVPVPVPVRATPEAPPAKEEAPVRGESTPPPPAGGGTESPRGATEGPGKPGGSGDEYGPSGGDTVGLPPGIGTPIWALPGVIPSAAPPKPAATVATGPRPVDPNIGGQVLAGSLHTKDKAAGIEIPGAKVVANTLADALRASTPLDARATFEVKLSGDGSVEGIRTVSASAGDASTWTRIVSSAKSALASRGLQMGTDGKGVTLIVKIESSVEYPSGSKQKIDVQPVCANEVIEQIEAAIASAAQGGLVRGLRDEKGTFVPYADMDQEQRRKWCIPIGIRAKGDSSDFGAHATNVVRSSFQVVRAGEKALDADAVLPVDTRVPWAREDPTKTRPSTAVPPKKKKKKKWK